MDMVTYRRDNFEEVVDRAVSYLRQGALVVYPTETCYGIGGNATCARSVSQVLGYKSKRADKPLSIAVCDKQMAQLYGEFNSSAHDIFDNFLPGPITLVVKGTDQVAPGVQSNRGTIGIRLPDYPLVREMVRQLGAPVTATSANASYKKTPYCVDDILQNISQRQKNMLGLLIDAGELPKRKPSTVIDTTLEGIHVLRRGEFMPSCDKTEVLQSLDDTARFAENLAGELAPHIAQRPVVILLNGDLGAGKTYFCKFLASCLGVREQVVSPTFILCNEYYCDYQGRPLVIYHLDAYRLYEAQEIDELGSDRIFGGANLVMIEWAGKVEEYITPYLQGAVVVKIFLEHTTQKQRRISYQISDAGS